MEKVLGSNSNVSILWRKEKCRFNLQCEHFLAKIQILTHKCTKRIFGQIIVFWNSMCVPTSSVYRPQGGQKSYLLHRIIIIVEQKSVLVQFMDFQSFFIMKHCTTIMQITIRSTFQIFKASRLDFFQFFRLFPL